MKNQEQDKRQNELSEFSNKSSVQQPLIHYMETLDSHLGDYGYLDNDDAMSEAASKARRWINQEKDDIPVGALKIYLLADYVIENVKVDSFSPNSVEDRSTLTENLNEKLKSLEGKKYDELENELFQKVSPTNKMRAAADQGASKDF